jgi:hypothetical protein
MNAAVQQTALINDLDCFWCGDDLFESDDWLICKGCAARFPKDRYITSPL